MTNRPEYTTLAQRYTARYPVLTYIGTQVNFWIIANALLAAVGWFVLRISEQLFTVPVEVKFWPLLLLSIITGLCYGLAVGFFGYYLERSFFRKLPLGKVILFKAIGSMMMLIALLLVTRFILFESFIAQSITFRSLVWNDTAWDNLFTLLLVYYASMTLVITFINQISRRYGPGVLIPLLLGRYRDPKETERIFMLMDLKSSTAIAEQLGHLRYSAFIRDCFADINAVLFEFNAHVYQYVGDEIVVMWPVEEGLRDHSCIRFFNACEKQFLQRNNHYQTAYGVLPDFKAGVHMGKVTAVEIGEIKRDIAYHGDTLNTAARIQSVCNEHGKNLLASEYLMEMLGPHAQLQVELLGRILLKGKAVEIGVVSIHWNDL